MKLKTNEDILKLIQDVPDYKQFLTVDELRESSNRLVQRFPQIVEKIPVGVSRNGYPIEALKIGQGSKTALVFAMPHPNEPIGSMTLEYLTARLAEDDELRESLDYTWYIIKCVDPDGTKLNEGWFKGPYTVRNYARHFYRPPSSLQVEWTFPVDYKTLHFNQPLPETQGLMALMEKVKPDFLFSLHNSGFGGAYFYLTSDFPVAYPTFYQIVESQKLPLHLGEAEVPYVQHYSDAIFEMIDVPMMYEFIAKQLNGADPAAAITGGGSSFSYASQFNPNLLGLVCEMPYFYNPAIQDRSPSQYTRREAITTASRATCHDLEILKEQYEAIQPFLNVTSPFKDVFAENLTSLYRHYQAQENWAQSDPSTLQIATQAEAFDSLLVSRFYELNTFGMFVRLMEDLLSAHGETPELKAAHSRAEALFNELSDQLEKDLNYSVIPIQQLVRVQLGAGLTVALNLQKAE
jgi:hypothetical protein